MKNNNTFLKIARFGLLSSILVLSGYLQAADSEYLNTEGPAIEQPEDIILHGSPVTEAPVTEDEMVSKPKSIFEAADLDGNGFLSLQEYYGLRESEKMNMLDEVYMAIDIDKDGMVSQEEILSAKDVMQVTNRMIQKVIMLDGQADKLSVAELEVLKLLSEQEQRIARQFKKADQNHDESVNEAELKAHKEAQNTRPARMERLQARLERNQARLEKLKSRLARTNNERVKKRLTIKIKKLEKSIAKLQQDLKPSPGYEDVELNELFRYEKMFNNATKSGKGYQFTYRSQASILREQALRITVHDNKVVQAIDLNDKENVVKGKTIDELFSDLKGDLANPDLDVSVRYHSKYGYPTYISTSLVDPNIADASSAYYVSDFIMIRR